MVILWSEDQELMREEKDRIKQRCWVGLANMKSERVLLVEQDDTNNNTLLQSIESDASSRPELEEMMVKLPCCEDTDPRLVGVALKKASTFSNSELVERVWDWSLRRRQSLLHHVSPDNDIALQYLQYVHAMSRFGRLDKALDAWNEWERSPLGLSNNPPAPSSATLRSVVVRAAAANGDIDTAEKLYRSRPASLAPSSTAAIEMLVSLITAYSHAGLPQKAVSQLREAEAAGPVDVRVYTAAIDACARTRNLDQTQAIIAEMRHKGVIPDDTTWMAFIRCGAVALEEMLTKFPCRENTNPKLVGVALKEASFAKNSELVDRVWKWSLRLRQSLLQRVSPDNDIALQYLQYVHAMSRIGRLDKALDAWNEWTKSPLGLSNLAPFSDLALSTMIAAVSFHGKAEIAEKLYRSRPPLYATPTPGFAESNGMLVSLLTAYSHAGLPQKAVSQLREAEAAGPVDLRVYTVAIDACARTGDFDQAQAIIAEMSAKGATLNAIVWMTLLSPCRRHLNVPVAEHAFKQLLLTGDSDQKSAAYVLMCDVYTSVGREGLSKELKDERLRLGLYKQQGTVEMNVFGKVHGFHVGEIPSELASYTEAIEAKLDEWFRFLSARGVSTESILCRHSEKIALAYAVVRGMKDVTLIQNLRICTNCHDASCALSLYEGIVIRHLDKSRVHVMQDGECTCGGRY